MTEHRARKRFGQHFLHDQNIIQRIITAINPQRNQTIIEIGPGKGALTVPLLEHLDCLHVLEVDRDLAYALEKKYENEQKIIIHCLDALTYDFKELGNQHLRIIGNLPYNISTPLIFHLLENNQIIDDMVFMLQEEVIDRTCASPGSKDFGRLSVMVQANCQAEKLFTVSPGAFSPPPKVMSAIIRLKPFDKVLNQISDYPCFAHVVKQAFSQRRKTLRNCLKGTLDERQIINLGIDPGARAETIAIENFIQLANAYHKENQ
ncbi:MAG: 16S rRNA (adenine(1518)-N(6)/adenine(1519)-N(6))-dimethyltransferase [Gammaproteobacteria bacterium]|nr:MAG: 16S rRNA (adenine(1518)-N(6)/adenine(1519)-N(6))-dimethyltransferase [Gammaproteobacteria bacterium]RKZ71840.1 MAG: 16S rRNA (adenine(1518)-N(6)/adenine(1519)-N(6))-dimethyltransferase [Gammaproteobacteria bacterium]